MSGDDQAMRGGDEILLAFARALRAGGIPVTQDRAQEFLSATAALGLGDPRAVRAAGRATLCAGPDDLQRFDQVFEAFFNARDGLPRTRPARPSAETSFTDLPLEDGTDEPEVADDVIRAAASTAEVLRHRDVAGLTPAEKHRLATLFATLQPRAAPASYGAPPGLAPRPGRRPPHPALEPAPARRAVRDRVAPPRPPGPAGSSCSSTSAAPCRPTPTPCCGSPIA